VRLGLDARPTSALGDPSQAPHLGVAGPALIIAGRVGDAHDFAGVRAGRAGGRDEPSGDALMVVAQVGAAERGLRATSRPATLHTFTVARSPYPGSDHRARRRA
jgi:hypothetical protein